MTLAEMAASNLVVALVLAVAAAAVGLWGRRPALTHLLWVLVLVKLVTPPLVRVPLAWPAPPPVAAEDAEEPAGVPVRMVLVGGGAAFEAAPEPPEAAAEPPAPFAWGYWPGAVWLAGMLGWYGLAWRRSAEFSRLLKLGLPAGPDLVQRVARLAALLGVRAPRVVLLPGRLPPLVWGAHDPVLALPEGIEARTAGAGLDTLVMHELAHVRRGDPWVRWLEASALGAWWWCPLAWYASRELREAEEQCCDAWVVRVLPGEKKAYAAALIDVLDFLAGAPSPPLMASGLGPVADLKRRLTMILRGVTPARMGRPASLAVLALAAVVLPLVPALSSGQAPPPAKPEENDVLFLKPDGKGVPIQLELRFEGDKPAGDPNLKALEIELARKIAELEDVRKKLAAARNKPLVGRTPNPNKAGGDGVVIAVEVNGVGKREVDALVQKIREAVGADRRVSVEVKRPAGKPPEGGIIIVGEKGGLRFTIPVESIMRPPAVVVPNPRQVPPPPLAPVPRGKSVEERLDALMKEVEALRREMKGR